MYRNIGQNILLSDIKKEYQRVLDIINIKRMKEDINKTVELKCDIQYHRNFLKERLKSVDIFTLNMMEQVNDCTYIWETIFTMNGFTTAFEIITGINDKTMEVDVLRQKRIN